MNGSIRQQWESGTPLGPRWVTCVQCSTTCRGAPSDQAPAVLFRCQTRSKSANHETVMVGKELRRLLSVSIPRSPGWEGAVYRRLPGLGKYLTLSSQPVSRLSLAVTCHSCTNFRSADGGYQREAFWFPGQELLTNYLGLIIRTSPCDASHRTTVIV